MDKKKLLKILSSNIRAERARINMKQDKLAELAGVSTEYISRIENEKVCPTILVVANIAKVLKVDLNILLPLK